MSFGAATDDRGTIWVAAAGLDTRVRVYRSTDYGRTWDGVLWFSLGADVPKVEVVYGPGDSSFVYVFYLVGLGDGDLRVVRISPAQTRHKDTMTQRGRKEGTGGQGDTGTEDTDEFEWQDFAVAVGPDTVNDFSVCADRDRHHYLYCLYANEMRTGRTGGFTRSLDFGKSWELAQPWWNCWDPHVIYGNGSTIHCAWRYAGTGREIHFQSSRYYGRPRRWWPVHVVSGTSQKCRDPVIAQADTAREWQATVWVCYTVARRDTQRLDIECAYSPNGGWGWVTGQTLGDPWADDWFADLAAFPGSASGYVHLCYNSGGTRADDNTTVRLRAANALEPGMWSRPLKMNDQRANARFEGCRPRVVCPKGAPRQWAGVLFSRYDSAYGSGLYFDAPWNLGEERERGTGNGSQPAAVWCEPNPFRRTTAVSLRLAAARPEELRIYDASGRPIRTLAVSPPVVWDGRDDAGRPVPAGTYFIRLEGAGRAESGRVTLLR